VESLVRDTLVEELRKEVTKTIESSIASRAR
jgi:hypothetical protein